MNILYIDPYLRMREKRYPYYSGVFHKLEQISNCFLLEGKKIEVDLQTCACEPDVIILGRSWFGLGIFGEIPVLRDMDIPTICYLFKAQSKLEEKLNFCKINNISTIITPLAGYKEYESQTGIPTVLFKQAGDPLIFEDRGLERIYDFGFSGALHNSDLYMDNSLRPLDLRFQVQNLVKEQTNLKCFLNGSDLIENRLDYKTYARKLNQSKIWLSIPAPFDDMIGRYYEIGMSRTLIFTSTIPETYRDVFRDGVNCIQFSEDLTDFLDKLYYYLKNDDERQKIANASHEEFHRLHTYQNRAEELLDIIDSLLRRQK